MVEKRGRRRPRSKRLAELKFERRLGTNERVAVILGIVIFCLAIFVAQIRPVNNEAISGMAVARGARGESTELDIRGLSVIQTCNTKRSVKSMMGPLQNARVEASTFKNGVLILDETLCQIKTNFIGLKRCEMKDAVRAGIMCESAKKNKDKLTGGCFFYTPTEGASKGKTFCAYVAPGR